MASRQRTGGSPKSSCSSRPPSEAGETYAEVAHEAVFRRWQRAPSDWIAAEREFLAWRSGLEAARRAWQDVPDASKTDALLTGFALGQAKQWFTKRSDDISEADRQFITQSAKVVHSRWIPARACWRLRQPW